MVPNRSKAVYSANVTNCILIPKLFMIINEEKFEKTIIFKSTHTENSRKHLFSLFLLITKGYKSSYSQGTDILRTRTHKLLYMTIVINELIFSRMEIG